jgi:membrane-associated protease RseP (regulator of RpoE activity)
MTIIETLSILAFIILSYGLGTMFLSKKGYFEKYNISFYGPALLFRTTKGINFLKKISSPKRAWRIFGSVGIAFCFIMMILMVYLLIINTWTVIGFTPEQQQQLPGIEFGLVIPGLNPILPLEYLAYILIGLIVAVIVHEFSHGILTFAHNLKVKSLGMLYLIIPLGAFCEPDEEQLKETKTKNRMRVYAAGPMSNFTIAFIVLFLFSTVCMGSVQPIDGVHVLYVVPESPADDLSLSAGMVITKVNNTTVTDVEGFLQIMKNTTAHQTIQITYYSDGTSVDTTVTLADQYAFTNNVSDRNKSFLGIGFNLYVSGFSKALQHPLTFAFPEGLILVYSLPFFSYLAGYNPLVAPFTQGYIISGPLSFIPPAVFWPMVNMLYWIFWLNLVVALFNVLPMIPLDGGFLFSDGLRLFVSKIRKNITEERREQIVKKISLVISLTILFIVLFPWFIKYF